MENVTVIDDLVTTAYVCQLFRRAPLTITQWRQHKGLPYVRIRSDCRDSIRYKTDEVTEWGRRTGRRMYVVERPAYQNDR